MHRALRLRSTEGKNSMEIYFDSDALRADYRTFPIGTIITVHLNNLHAVPR